jgi:hypothetical protein
MHLPPDLYAIVASRIRAHASVFLEPRSLHDPVFPTRFSTYLILLCCMPYICCRLCPLGSPSFTQHHHPMWTHHHHLSVGPPRHPTNHHISVGSVGSVGSLPPSPQVLWQEEEQRFRMWYRGGWASTAVGVADSTDGITWTKHQVRRCSTVRRGDASPSLHELALYQH